MYAVIVCNVLGFTVAASIQSIISSAADARTQGQTMGAVSSLNSLMAVVAPVIGAPLLGVVSHLPHGDWRIGAPFYFCAALQLRRTACSPWLHFRAPARATPRRRRRRPPRLTPMHDKILILDFGSQVTQLIARRVREAHVYCEIHPNDVSDAFIREFAPKGIILSGSHASTYEEHELRAPQAVWELGVPVLGICYGMFTMAVQQGGEVEASTHREFGYAEVRARGHTRLLDGIEDFSHRRRPRHAEGVDEPRRQGHRAAAGLQADGVRRRAARSPAWPTRRAATTACSSTPRSRTRCRAGSCSSASCSRSAAPGPTG